MKQNNIIGFFSPVAASGTTSITLSVAKTIAEYTDITVGVLMLNVLDDGSDYLEEVPAFLDELKPLLAGESLESDADFLSKFAKFGPKVHVLAGNKNRRLERQFLPNEINYLIKRANDVFDLVLLDGGCHYDNALSIVSLNQSSKRYMIHTQQPKSIKRYNQLVKQILQPLNLNLSEFNNIVNAYQDKSYNLTTKHLMKEMNLENLTTVSYVEKGSLAELESRFLIEVAEDKYIQEIEEISKEISRGLDLSWREEPKKKGLTSFFKKT